MSGISGAAIMSAFIFRYAAISDKVRYLHGTSGIVFLVLLHVFYYLPSAIMAPLVAGMDYEKTLVHEFNVSYLNYEVSQKGAKNSFGGPRKFYAKKIRGDQALLCGNFLCFLKHFSYINSLGPLLSFQHKITLVTFYIFHLISLNHSINPLF
jgi:hypothetical protein